MHPKFGRLVFGCVAAFTASAQTPTTTILTASETAVTLGREITLTAAVTPSSAAGKVAFYSDVTILGTVPLVSGKAVLSNVLLATGPHSLYAAYQPGTGSEKSTSSVVKVTVSSLPGAGFSPPLFSPALTGSATTPSMVLADFNRDGISDVAFTCNGNCEFPLTIMLGKGNGTFAVPVNYSLPSDYRAATVQAGDVNGDSKLDLVIGGWTLDSKGFQSRGFINVMLGNGDGTFQIGETFSLSKFVIQLAIGDFNNDGNPDLLVLKGVCGSRDTVFQVFGRRTGGIQAAR
jgi:hypothetical protein